MKEEVQEKLNNLELDLGNTLNQLVGLKTLNESLKNELKIKDNTDVLKVPHVQLNLPETRDKVIRLMERVDTLIQSIQKDGI